MKKIIILFFVFFISLSCIWAGDNNTTDAYVSDIHNISSDNFTYALEDGHLNTSFDNGYNGYCIEYGEQEANVGDKFAVANTSYIKNNPSNKDVSNYIKTYFVYFYDDMIQNPPVYTQHIIWYYTDNFTHSITTPPEKISLINAIAENRQIPDDGKRKMENNTTMVYSFRSLISPLSGYQNYFAYRIYFKNNINDNIANPEQNNITNITETVNKTYNITYNTQNNNSTNYFNKTYIKNTNDKHQTYTSKHQYNSSLSKYKTGNSIIGILVTIIFIICISLIRRE